MQEHQPIPTTSTRARHPAVEPGLHGIVRGNPDSHRSRRHGRPWPGSGSTSRVRPVTARREMPDTFHTITVLVGVSFPSMPRTHRRSSMTTISFENPSSDNKLKMKLIRHPLPSLTARDHLETLCVIAVAIDIAMSRDLGAKSCRAPVRLTTTMTGALEGPPQQPSRPARETPHSRPHKKTSASVLDK